MFLDIAIGIVAPLFVAHLFQFEATGGFVLFGILSSLLPDIDIIVYGFRKYVLHRKINDHRSWTHYPIVYILLSPAVFIFMSPLHGIVFLLCILFHFIHDSLWIGWGVSWFWPFSNRRYKFFPLKNGKSARQLKMTWLPREDEAIQKQLHDSHWIRDFYLRISVVSIVEYSAIIISLVFLKLYLN